MKGNKLFQILQTLSRKEMTRFREFAYSPYFNKHREVRELVGYLSQRYPDFDEKSCHRTTLFQLLFPQQTHDQNKLAVVFTYTLRLLEAFLMEERYQARQPLHQILLLDALRYKKQYALYEKTLRAVETAFYREEAMDVAFYNWKYQLAAEADAYFNQIEQRKTDQSIQLKQNNLDKFYIIEKLRDACEMQVRRRILNVNYATRMLEAVLREVDENPEEYMQEPLIVMYYQIYRMVTQTEHERYFDALKTLQQQGTRFSDEVLQEVYNYFQNYCIEQINKGEGQFLQEIFVLYQARLERGLLIENGYLSEWHYKNIVTTAIRLREMDWVKHFIEAYKSRLSPEVMENAYCFNLASYHYAMQQYDQVLELLLRLEYSDLRYSLGAKALLLRTYYDLEEYDALMSLVQSFSLYLKRNKLMADPNREGYQNLFKFARRAAQIRANLYYTSKTKLYPQLTKLITEVSNTSAVFNKGWLLEKLQALEAAFTA